MADEPEDESTEERFRRVQEELRALELPNMPDDEVEARVARIKERTPTGLPDVPTDLDARLGKFESRAAAAKVVHDKAKGTEYSRIASDGKATRGLGVGLAIAYALIGLPLVGALLGFLLSRVVGGPWVAIGAVLGFIGGIAFTVYLSAREGNRT